MESGDGNTVSGNKEKNAEIGEKCEKVEEMSKLKEESIITNKGSPDQVEKTKGKGLKKWKRRRRETSKDIGHFQEPQRMLHKRVNPHAGQLNTSKGVSNVNKQKNETNDSESSVSNNIDASSSFLGFTHPDRDSGSGSCYAVLNAFPTGCGKDQSYTSYPKGVPENLTTEEPLNDVDVGSIDNREEMNYPQLFRGGIELPVGGRTSGTGDKRSVGPTKKARAEKFESNPSSEDSVPEQDDSIISTGRIILKGEGDSEYLFENFPATCMWDFDNHEESSCSTANNIGILAVSTSGHTNAVMTSNDRNVVCINEHESLDDLGESSCSRANNLGLSVVRGSPHSNAVVAKSDRNTNLGNGMWTTEEFKLWCENFEPENSSFERQDSEEDQILEAETLNGNGSIWREGEDIRENPVLMCDSVAHSEESFQFAATSGAKEIKKRPYSPAHGNGTHPQPGESACLVQAMNQLKMAEEALQQEVQQMKDLGKVIEQLQMKNSDFGIYSVSDCVNKHLHKDDGTEVGNSSHVVERAERESNIEKQKILQKELEAEKKRTISEQTKVKEFELPSKDQEIKFKDSKLPSEWAVTELQLMQEKCKEMETELEVQFKENMQAEMEYLMLNNANTMNVSLADNESSVQMKGLEHGICFDSNNIRKHLHKHDSSDVPNGTHVEEKAERERPLEGSQSNKMNEQLKLLQKELEAANKRTLSEQTKVKELEVLFKDQKIKSKEAMPPSEGSASESQCLQAKCKEMERELEEQYKEHMHAEIEFLMLSNAATRSIALVENETSLLQEQKDLIIEQIQTALKLKHAEGRALSLRDQITELEDACGSLSEVEELMTLHNKLCRSSLYSFIQFILFCVAILLFAQSSNVPNLVPT